MGLPMGTNVHKLTKAVSRTASCRYGMSGFVYAFMCVWVRVSRSVYACS